MADSRDFNLDIAAIAVQFEVVLDMYKEPLENGKLILDTLVAMGEERGGMVKVNDMLATYIAFRRSEEHLLAIKNRATDAMELLHQQNLVASKLFGPLSAERE